MRDTSRIVARLIKKELVSKQTSLYDKRLVDISISAKGTVLLEKLDKQDDKLDSIVGSLGLEETKTLNALLDKLREKR